MAREVSPHTSEFAAVAPPSSPLMHFSHPHGLHPLALYNLQTLCSACKLPSSGIMYACNLPCGFTLHQSCAALPQLITHPSHAGCTLYLLTTACYQGGIFSCDGCGRRGDGWSYHCSCCEYDLHVTCASKPLKIRHQAHSSCELELTFKSPYSNSNGFACDICRKIGTKQWLYHCSPCEFDVHLDCITAPQHSRSFPGTGTAGTSLRPSELTHSASTGGTNPFSSPPLHLLPAASTGAAGINPYGLSQFHGHVNQGQFSGPEVGTMQMNNQRPLRDGDLGTNLMMAAMQGLVEGAFQGVGQEATGGSGRDDGGGSTDGGGVGDFPLY